MAAALALPLALCSCGGAGTVAGDGSGRTAIAARAVVGRFDGRTVNRPTPAPLLALRDYHGRMVDISTYRGKAVLVTFIYTHCPDTCPLETANLHNALAMLGAKAAEVKIVAVSTDPRGDTPAAVRAFLARHDMIGRMEYLIGTPSELSYTWQAWGIATTAPTAEDRVNHSAGVFGIAASGRVTTVYPSNFKPAQIAHDIPLLAAQ